MLYQYSPQEMVSKILEAGKITQFLKQNDDMLLKWNKSQLYKRWPRCMVPNQEKDAATNLFFTGMLGNIKDKAYQYDNTSKLITNFEKFNQPVSRKSTIKTEPKQYLKEEMKEKLKQQMKQEVKQEIKQGQFRVQVQVGDNQQNTQILSKSHKSIKSFSLQKQLSEQKFRSHQFFSPFLPNRDNPFDRNANAKILKQKFDKIKIDPMRRNIVALVQSSKGSNDQRQQFQYGKSMPKRTTDSINISDILKYTLGLKKEREQGIKPEPIKNPFVRVPAKYYASMGDFYTPGNHGQR